MMATKKSGLSQIGREDDAAVITDADGTLSAFLRGLVKMFASGLSVTGMPASVGQKAMAASLPVTIASDQSNLLPLAIVGAHVQNTDLDAVVEITVPAGACQWLVQCQTKDVRFTLDGSTAATAAIGFLLKADAPPVIIPVVPAQVIHVIEVATSSKLDYQFGA
jgi:hypothetical protein